MVGGQPAGRALQLVIFLLTVSTEGTSLSPVDDLGDGLCPGGHSADCFAPE